MTSNHDDLPAPGGDTVEGSFVRSLSPVVFAILSLVAVFLLYQFVAGGVVMLLARGRITEENVGLIRWSTILGQTLCILLPTILLVRMRHGNVIRFLRVDLPRPGQLLAAVIGVFALQQMAQGYMIAQDAIPLPETIQKLVDLFREVFEQAYRVLVTARSPSEFLFVLCTVAVVPALSEELLFRGLVQRSLEESIGGFRAALLAGVIFGAYHLNPFGIVPLVALGVFFGFLVYRSGNITLAIAAHFFNNFIACTAVYLQLDDDFVALAPAGGASAALLIGNFVFFALVFLGAMYYFSRVTRPQE